MSRVSSMPVIDDDKKRSRPRPQAAHSKAAPPLKPAHTQAKPAKTPTTSDFATSFGSRLRQARRQAGLTQQALADGLGEYQSNISAWEKDSWMPSGKKLLNIAKLLTCDHLWLEYGDTTRARSGSALPPKTYRMVPMISWVEAGDFSETSDPYPVGQADSHVAFPSHKDTLIALVVSGSSCNREFPHDTTIIVDYADKQLIDGKFYVFRHEGSATLKRYRACPARLEPFSTDSTHETIFPAGDVEVVGRVIAKIKEY